MRRRAVPRRGIREHDGWEQACLRTSDERSRVQCLVPARGARRDMALDEVSAAIPRDAVARNANGNLRRPLNYDAISAGVLPVVRLTRLLEHLF